jgi:hypothetical protein
MRLATLTGERSEQPERLPLGETCEEGRVLRLDDLDRTPCELRSARRHRKLCRTRDHKEEDVYARVATFESDPSKVDDAITMVRDQVASGDTPAGLEGAKMLMLVDRTSGKGVGITLFDSEEAMRRGDEALNAMNPGGTERRVSVEFFEVPVHTVG